MSKESKTPRTDELRNNPNGIASKWILDEYAKLETELAEAKREVEIWKEMTQQRINQVVKLDNKKASLEKQLEQARKDMERLSWILSNAFETVPAGGERFLLRVIKDFAIWNDAKLDGRTSIDAAIAAQKKEN